MAATILLVVAEQSTRDDWRELLAEQGYDIVEIGIGERAPELCLHLRPDLVLIDASLPDVSGFEVCRQLKEDPRNRLTPMLMITSFSGQQNLSRAQAAGADDLWEPHPSRWEALTRVQSLMQIKTYIDEQAEAVLVSLARSVEARDPYTRGHSERISSAAVGFGKKIGLSSDQLDALYIAGIVHDIGKVMVPDAVLMKPGRLDTDEMKIIRQHPVEGERICSPIKSLRRVLPIIRHHHERIDGSGYPDGLRGETIPLTARVLQIVDIYDALTTDRPYRAAFSAQQALATMFEESDLGKLDGGLMRIFPTYAIGPQAVRAASGSFDQIRKSRLIN
jgi:putative two-component system response regulator